VIIDDEPVARKLLAEYIEDIPFLQLVGTAVNPVKANELLRSEKADLLFLDINMPEMSGIDFLKSNAQLPLAIITTAYPGYAIEGFELDVLDYLVKPFSSERFLKACLKAKEYYELKAGATDSGKPTADYFFVKCNGRFEKIFFEELIYIEAMQNYVILHTADERKLIAYLTIKSILAQLPSELFLKVHKSTIINLGKVKSIEGNIISLGKASVTISQNLQEEVLDAIVRKNLLRRE
jgi:DNA-binding LytR/AlgR family response regulator